MDENVFKLGDLVKQEIAPVVTQKNPEDWLKLIENIFTTVTKFQEKAQTFQGMYGRPPSTKQEMKSGVPTQHLDKPTQATQEQINRQEQEKQAQNKEVVELKPRINEEKLNIFVDTNISMLLQKADENKDKKVSDLISMFNNYKLFIIPKLKKELKENLKEMIEYDK
jgi:hypothetical protein